MLDVGLPRIGSTFALDLDAEAAAPLLLVLGLTPQAVPLPGGCQFLVAPLLSTFLVADGNGHASSGAFRLPMDPALRGQLVAAQIGARVASGPAFGLALSDALDLRIGD